MNWLKRATYPVRIPTEINDDISYIVNYITDYFKEKREGNEVIGTLSFKDPYHGDIQKVMVHVSSPAKDDSTVASYSFEKAYDDKDTFFGKKKFLGNTLTIYPYNITEEEKTKNLPDVFKGYIKHELTHAIDPKFQQNNKFQGQQKQIELSNKKKNEGDKFDFYNYYNFLPEFEAFCSQLITNIEGMIEQNYKIKNDVIEWIRSGRNNIPYFLSSSERILSRWIQHDKVSNDKHKFMIIFKNRLYNEIFNKRTSSSSGWFKKIAQQYPAEDLNDPNKDLPVVTPENIGEYIDPEEEETVDTEQTMPAGIQEETTQIEQQPQEIEDEFSIIGRAIDTNQCLKFEYINRKGKYSGTRIVESYGTFIAQGTGNELLVGWDRTASTNNVGGGIRAFIINGIVPGTLKLLKGQFYSFIKDKFIFKPM